MTDKRRPVGTCDLCGGAIPLADWYTTKGKPRLYCSVDCKNTANSRAGEPIRYKKLIERIERGEWRNPAELHPPTPQEQGRRARLGRLREVAAGVWHNPAMTDQAREKLSRPRKHTGALAAAIEKLGRSKNLKMADLTDDERSAYLEYRQRLRAEKRAAGQ